MTYIYNVTSENRLINFKDSVDNAKNNNISSIEKTPLLENLYIIKENFSFPKSLTPLEKNTPEINVDLIDFLKKQASNSISEKNIDVIYEKTKDKINSLTLSQIKNGIDISSFSGVSSSLLIAMNLLLLLLSKSDTSLSSKLSLISYDTVKNTASSMIKEGTGILTGNVLQASMQLGIGVAGGKMQHKGLNMERNSLKNNFSNMNKLSAESDNIKKTLRNNNKELFKPNNSLDSNTNKTTPSFEKNPIISNSKVENQEINSISLEKRTELSKRLESIESDYKNEEFEFSKNKIDARKKQTVGDIISKSAVSVGSIAGSSGQYAAILERSQQQINQSSSKISDHSSEQMTDSSKKSLNMIQELINIMQNINQSNYSAMSAITANIRV